MRYGIEKSKKEMIIVEKKKSIICSLLILLLSLSCLLVGRLLVTGGETAQAAVGGPYQVSCGSGYEYSIDCVVLNTETGVVVNVFSPEYFEGVGKSENFKCSWTESEKTCNQFLLR